MLLPRHSSKIQPHGSQATTRPSRLRSPGLRLKTSSLDLIPSDEKAQAMASADWRKMAPDSGLGDNRQQISDENSRHPSDQNDGFYSPFVLGMKPMNTGSRAQYQYARDPTSGIAWEVISSAPGCDFRREETRTSESSGIPSSILKACQPNLQNTTMVRLKAIKPMNVSINGDIIKLPNKYSLDVTPVDIQEPDAACFMNREHGEILATLKLLKPKARLRRMKSELHEESVLKDLDDFLSQQSGKPPKVVAASKEAQRQNRRSSGHWSSHDSGISTSSETSGLQKEMPLGAHHRTPAEGHRFQTLLSRLHLTTETREASQPPTAPDHAETSKSHAQVVDPAIIAAKVKDEEREETPDNSERGAREGTFFGRDSTLLFGKGKWAQKSHDSGYSTFHFMKQGTQEPTRPKAVEHFGPTVQKRKEDSTSCSTTSTKLNPTAAEFKSVTKGDLKSGVKSDFKPAPAAYPAPPWTPKRRTRPLLNNIFPGVLEDPGFMAQTVPFVANDCLQGSPWQTSGPPTGPVWVAEPGQPIPEMAFQPPVAPIAMAPLPIVDPVTQQLVPPPFAPPPSNFGTFPPSGIAPIASQMPGPNPVFSTLPPLRPPPAPRPRFSQPIPIPPGQRAPMPAVPNATSFQAPTLYGPTLVAGPPPPLAWDGKGPRPVFPVTQKPRDHDPVKQQAYESYLEWRKANEPGYHMKCKMRQAHRVVRQYQQQAQTADWKTVAGQAKAAAGALEAHAAEEKRRSKEAALKEQFKMSVKRVAESSGATEIKEQTLPDTNNEKQTQTLVI